MFSLIGKKTTTVSCTLPSAEKHSSKLYLTLRSNASLLIKQIPYLETIDSKFNSHHHPSLPGLSEIHVTCLHGVLRRPLLPFGHMAAHVTADVESSCVGEVVLGLQDTAELYRGLQDDLVKGIKDLGVEIRWRVGLLVGRIGGGEGDGVVMDARVHQDAALRSALIVTVGSQGLDINRTYFHVEMLAQNVQLDTAAPCVLGLDPSAVVVDFSVENGFGVNVRMRLDVLCDD